MTDQGQVVLDAIRDRRSIRRYTDEAVPRAMLEQILEAGRWAPSGLNNQPWKFLALFAGDPRQEALAGCTRYGHIVRAAKALVAVFLDKGAMYHGLKDHQGAGACIQNMLLAAHALGLGAVWLGEIVNQEDKALSAIGIKPEDYEFMALLAIGHPAEKGASARRPLSEIMIEAW